MSATASKGLAAVPRVGLHRQLEYLRRELVEQAYALDRHGRHDAADVAMQTASRLAELTQPEQPAD